MASGEQKFLLRVPDELASVLKKLHPTIKSHIRSGLKAVLENPYSGKALKDELHGLRSYRVKRYRIVYRIRPKKRHIEIAAIGPRKVIYEETFRILKKQVGTDFTDYTVKSKSRYKRHQCQRQNRAIRAKIISRADGRKRTFSSANVEP